MTDVLNLSVATPRASDDLREARPLDVLVVDHERTFAESLAVALGAAGWSVGSATPAEVLRAPGAVAHTAGTLVLGSSEVAQRELLALLGHYGPDTRVVVLLGEPDDVTLLPPLVRAGARGWACKTDTVEHLERVVREVADGGWWLPRTVLGDVMEGMRRAAEERADARFASLTPRERQVLAGLVEGMSRNAIAKRHRMSVNTVRTHIQHVFEKLEVHSCLEAIVLAQSRPAELLEA